MIAVSARCSHLRRAAAAGLIASLAPGACAAFRRQPPPPDGQVEVPASQAAIWAGLVDALMTYDVPLLSYDQGKGHAVAETRTIDSAYVTYADCGRSRATRPLPTRALLETWIVPDSSSSRVTIRASYFITSPSDEREAACRSTGELERRIAVHATEHAQQWRARRSGGRTPPPN